VLGLTATPIERDIEDGYNVGRIIAPNLMPTVADFEKIYVAQRDRYGRIRLRPGRQQVFAHLFQQIVIRKRKTDDDVLAEFPKQVEEGLPVALNAEHVKLYEAVEAMLNTADGEGSEAQERRLFTVLRMVAGHPASLLHSESELALSVVEAVGAERLRQIKSTKVEELLSKLDVIVRGQGAQVVIFTFFANTVLPEVRRELVDAGYLVSTYTGSQTDAKNEMSKKEFKQGDTQILLCSDAAARGINLENAQYVIEYESALTYSNRNQRINRIHRISSEIPSVTCITMIAENTIEEGLVQLMLRRNGDQDTLLGDTDDGTAFITAGERRKLLRVYRDRRRTK
jgi:SNF2 family DNA or RNA helicase